MVTFQLIIPPTLTFISAQDTSLNVLNVKILVGRSYHIFKENSPRICNTAFVKFLHSTSLVFTHL